MPRPFRRVALGGTFDRLHVGHDALFAAAFAAGRTVVVGLTTDGYLASHPKPARERLRPYDARARALRAHLRRKFPAGRFEIAPIEDRFGRAVEPGIDALVVSIETLAGGRAVNRERRRRKRAALPLLVVPLVLGDDLEPVSSRRIRAGLIGPRGERRAPLEVAVASDRADDLATTARAVRRAWPNASVSRRTFRWPAGSSADTSARRFSRRALQGASFAVGVARAGVGGWSVAVRTKTVGPLLVRVPGASASALTQGLFRVLRPSRRKPI